MQHITRSDGRINWWGVFFYLGTFTLLMFTLYQMYLSIRRGKSADILQYAKIRELETNLREVRGNQYKENPTSAVIAATT